MKVSEIIPIVIFLVVGFAFLGIVSSYTARVSATYQVVNETFAGVTMAEIATANLPIHEVNYFLNATNSTYAHYNYTDNGILVADTGTYFVTYSYEDAIYSDNIAIRAISAITPLLYILMLLLGGGMLLYIISKK